MNRIHILINSGSIGNEPILGYLNKYFAGTLFQWEVTVIHSAVEAYEAALKQLETCDYLGVYGGDGTIMQVSRALHSQSIPLVIFPGGTANVLAKELNIPLDLETSIQVFSRNDFEILKMDMGMVNGMPFLIRVNLGILADMVTQASPLMKEQWGQWAYGISAFKDLDHPEKTYKISLDGHTFRLEAVALTITNIGNIGKKGFSFLPGIKVDDGFLDIIALNHADFISLFKITGTTLLQKESSVLKHWKAKSIRIEMDEPISFICDDIEVTASGIDIMVSPKSLNVVIPNRKSP